MQLRPYQLEAREAFREAFRAGVQRPLVCLPTGSGKSAVIASLLNEVINVSPATDRFIVAVHTQELVTQLAETYERVSGRRASIYSSSLKRKQIGQANFVQIQSVHKKAHLFGPCRLVVIDECDRIPVLGEGQYRNFIRELTIINPNTRFAGLTATPYRTGSGLCFGEGMPFESLVYDANIRELIDGGFLSPLASKNGGAPDLSQVHMRAGDYVPAELELCMSSEDKVRHAITEIIRYGQDRCGWLVFASGLKHAELLRLEFERQGMVVPVIEGSMSDADRRGYISKFRSKELRCLINVNVLSIGFDAPHVDLIALLRPTKSPALYYQQIGRGLRMCEGKSNCLVLDMSGNIYFHGPIDTLNDRITTKKKKDELGEAPVKTCEQCQEICPAGCRKCPSCGHEFPPLEIAKHEARAADVSPLSEVNELTVDSVNYRIHPSKDATKPDTIKITYRCGLTSVNEWWSLDVMANSYARRKSLDQLTATPVQAESGYRVAVIGGSIQVRDPTGSVTEVVTASDCLPWIGYLQMPISICCTSDPANPRYLRVVSRKFSTSLIE